MVQLTSDEFKNLKSQFAISSRKEIKTGWGWNLSPTGDLSDEMSG